jgi:hypothetical protein
MSGGTRKQVITAATAATQNTTFFLKNRISFISIIPSLKLLGTLCHHIAKIARVYGNKIAAVALQQRLS